MTEADDIMLKRKPKRNPLWPEHNEVPEGALARKGLELSPVVPYAKFGKRVYGRRTAVEVGIKGEF